jgi:type IV pilus assembly protein PilZ
MPPDPGDDGGQSDANRQPIELKVEYKRLNTFFSDYTRNISRGGTFIKTHRPLAVGTEFIFKLYVPQLEQPIAIHAQVERVVSEADVAAGRGGEPQPGMCIQFRYRQGDRREDIERTVERLMVGSLGRRLYSRLMMAAQPEEP